MMRETPLWRRYQRLWGQNAVEDASDELEFHLSMRISDLVRKGLTETEARAQAIREFGDVEASCISSARQHIECAIEQIRRRGQVLLAHIDRLYEDGFAAGGSQ